MRKSPVYIVLVFLLAACGSTVTPSPVPATATLTAPTATRIPPTETPMPTDTPVPPTALPTVALPTLTATATATETPTTISIPALGARVSARTYGGEYNDSASDVLLLDDGGMLIAGQANNTGLSHRITPGNARLIRIDSDEEIVWEKDYGGEIDALFCSLIQVGDDEYVVLGDIAASYERDETDFYLVRIDGEGNEIWSRT